MIQRGIDLHCDLLSYLSAWPEHTAYDADSVVNLHHVEEGGIGTLILPVFSPTKKGSETALEQQMALFKKLSSRVKLIPAIENASCFVGEEEPLDEGIGRLKRVCASGIKFLYLSLTWNGENRFGGGVGSDKGLTFDGEKLLDALPPFVTAIDFSHTSDSLARDLLKYLDKTKSPLKLMASHSNFRVVQNARRNLPDDIAAEIVRKNGIIGLNVIRSFVGPSYESFFAHIAHALSNGWGKHIALGADFFYTDFEHTSEIPKELERVPHDQMRTKFLEHHFFPECKDASCLKNLFLEVSSRFGKEVGEGFWWKNVHNWLA